jgi:uncharacterized membrane protein YfcA
VTELALGVGALVALIAFTAEYIDSTLGMGYGTMLTPLLLLLGFEPLEVVPVILLSELVTGLLAGIIHHTYGNVDFKPRTRHLWPNNGEGLARRIRRSLPRHLKIAMLLGALSVVGSMAAVMLAISLPKFYLQLYIGVLILAVGVFILATAGKKFRFTWGRIQMVGLVASFNKGISGGGYGPVVTGGQLLAGVDGRNAVGITSLAEGITCVAGLTAYILTRQAAGWALAPYLVTGAVLSVPLSAYSVKKINTKHLRSIIGIVTVILGGLTLAKLAVS